MHFSLEGILLGKSDDLISLENLPAGKKVYVALHIWIKLTVKDGLHSREDLSLAHISMHELDLRFALFKCFLRVGLTTAAENGLESASEAIDVEFGALWKRMK